VLNYILYGIDIILFLCIVIIQIINGIRYNKDKGVILENKIIVLEQEETYDICYRPHRNSRPQFWTIRTSKDHVTIMTMTTRYTGVTDVTINVHSNNMIIYSVYLRNFVDFVKLDDAEIEFSGDNS